MTRWTGKENLSINNAVFSKIRCVVWTGMAYAGWQQCCHSNRWNEAHHMSAAPVIGLKAITSGAVCTREEEVSVTWCTRVVALGHVHSTSYYVHHTTDAHSHHVI